MRKGAHHLAFTVLAAWLALPAPPARAEVEVRLDVDLLKDNREISPFIYGINSDFLGTAEGVTFRRQGGNRLSGYNWENNASHAGLDWQHSSDGYLGGGLVPGKAVTDFHDRSLDEKTRSLVTLQAAGYVSRDKRGPVGIQETAPSSRWVQVAFEKGAPFAATPDTSDGKVHMDEFVDFLVKRYGAAGSARGIAAYSMDNEPALWPSTHPRLHPDTPTCVEIVTKNAALAAAVKKVDPAAEIYGGVFYGYGAYQTFQGAKDWKAIEKQAADAGRPYAWFLDYFLDGMRKASDQAGRRLLDVLDLHYYSEARGTKRVTELDATSAADRAARVQAPRSLWDSAYAEDSWISKWATPKQPVTDWGDPTPGPILLLPRVLASIRKFYPGTRLAFTEWNFGEGGHVSGGLAAADFLGIAGRHGVHAAHYWPLEEGSAYAAAAFRLFRNYDGKGSAFPAVSAQATASDRGAASVYAAFRSGGDALHLVVLNKHASEPLRADIRLASPVAFASAEVFGFDASGPVISAKAPVAALTGNALVYTLPPQSAYHFVLNASAPLPASLPFPGMKPLAGRIPGIPLRGYRVDGRAADSRHAPAAGIVLPGAR